MPISGAWGEGQQKRPQRTHPSHPPGTTVKPWTPQCSIHLGAAQHWQAAAVKAPRFWIPAYTADFSQGAEQGGR